MNVEIENNFIPFDKKKIRTKIQVGHGLGLLNVEEMVRKYYGVMEKMVKEEKGMYWYKVKILLYILKKTC